MLNDEYIIQKELEKLKKLKLQKLNLLQKEIYKKYPEKWFFEGEPETLLNWSLWDKEKYDNHAWDGTKNPFLTAIRALAHGKNVAIEAATGVGKTYFLPRVIYWFLDVFDNSLVITTAPTGEQLRRALWGEIEMSFNAFKRIRPRAEKKASLQLFPEGKPKTIKDDNDNNDLMNAYVCTGITTSVSAAAQSAIKFQGSHREYMLHVVDEGAGMTLPVLTAIENTSVGDFNPTLVVGNPDSQTDALHTFAAKPSTIHIRISAFDHPNVVLEKTVIHGAVTLKSIDKRKLEYGEHSNLYLSRVKGVSPKQAAASVIQYDWIAQCCKIKPEFNPELPVHKWSFDAIGIDVANSENGDDAAVAYGKKHILKEIKAFKCPDSNHLAYNLMFDEDRLRQLNKLVYSIPTAHDYNVNAEQIGVDAAGIGGSTVHSFSDEGWNVASLQNTIIKENIPLDNENKPMYDFNSFRTQMIFTAAQELRAGEIVIEIDDPFLLDKLIKQATVHQYTITLGKISIEPKQEVIKKIGQSPNEFDAFIYWNWMRKDRNIVNNYDGNDVLAGDGIDYSETNEDNEEYIF